MSKIKVRYIGIIRNLVTGEKREEKIEIGEGKSLGNLIDLLSGGYGERFKHTIHF